MSVWRVVVKCCPARGCLGDRILQVDPKCSGEGAYWFASEDFFNVQLNKLLLDRRWEDGEDLWGRTGGNILQANDMALGDSLPVFQP